MNNDIEVGEALTKAGGARKRAPGAGRPCAGRSVRLPRVSEEAGSALALVQAALARPGPALPPGVPPPSSPT